MNDPLATEVIKALGKASQRHTLTDTFQAMVDMAFCAYAKPMATTQEKRDELEAQYMRQVERMGKETVRNVFPELIGKMHSSYMNPENCIDHFGHLAAEIGALSSDMGQYFTPMSVSLMMAHMTCDTIDTTKRFVTVAEPAAGSGAMVLAMQHALRQKAASTGRSAPDMWIEATELNYLSFQMCYLALAWSGIAGRVTHGNTLTNEHFEIAILPNSMAFVLEHGDPFAAPEFVPIRKRTRPVKPDGGGNSKGPLHTGGAGAVQNSDGQDFKQKSKPIEFTPHRRRKRAHD